MRYLVRHGHAGDKHLWAGADDDRPLSSTGQREARGLVALLAGYSVDKIVSSPALRCAQTVQPLAEQRGLVVRTDVALSVDADHTLAQCSRAARGGGATCANQTPIGTVASARKASCSGSTATSTSCSRSCASPRRACRSCSRSCSHWPSPSASVRSPASRVVCTTAPWWPPRWRPAC